MATSSGNRGTNTTKKTTTRKKQPTSKAKQKSTKVTHKTAQESAISSEVMLIALFAVMILLFLCNFGLIGKVGLVISDIQFGLFGIMAYIIPIIIFIAVAFRVSNYGSFVANIKLVAGIGLFICISAGLHVFSGQLDTMETYSVVTLYQTAVSTKQGGGAIGGSFAYLLYYLLDFVGTILVLLVCTIIFLVLVTQKSFWGGVKKSSMKVYSSAKEDAQYRRERADTRREEAVRLKQERTMKREEELAKKDAEKILRMDRKVSGVTKDTVIPENLQMCQSKNIVNHDMHEIIVEEDLPVTKITKVCQSEDAFDFSNIRVHKASMDANDSVTEENHNELPFVENSKDTEEIKLQMTEHDPFDFEMDDMIYEQEELQLEPVKKAVDAKKQEQMVPSKINMEDEIHKKPNTVHKKYIFPPITRLHKTKLAKSDSTLQLKETAMQLQQTLQTFGVKVTITDISQGPAVTRYELQPEPGVKVSKIVGLSDDIKLNLAATDIRIEAPIPGKAAVGIEVPNKENATVGLRELLENKNFKEFKSKLAFAVGKDISGNIVVTDIAKMPHMLIAGATGSGKSVCINTLIMSILYKAHPDDVKLIMIDPKVVELSVYNGIPHLLIPVVTDCKKAAAALHWGVAEMTDRYQKFADFNVRDLAGYNKQLEAMKAKGDSDVPSKMPQIVIIVDELADLMMVAPGEVEEAICRLAQLARAAGIHLIIATQRPSVDVITGLIKANMPSRIAFSVSSGIDSRTILDMNGAEKLLGKGDMLFYPQGYSKPMRMQGAFVSDTEVFDVVDFLKNQTLGNIYNEDIEEKIKSIGTSSSTSNASGDGVDEKDQYFVDAGRFIIEKEKASIGMLQRVFKIGFNRAARIMDQLSDAGVVGEEEGTKPRKVLMSMEQFDLYIEEYL
ncbi:MAG: DNA translocase FtsK [Eubacteriales bacterium]